MRRPLALVLILLVALALRLTFGFTQSTDLTTIAKTLPDQGEYLQLARNVLDSRGLVLHDERFGQDVYAYRIPGYPLFVAALGANVTLVRVAQALLDTSTVLAAYLIARRVVSDRAGLLAAMLVAIDPFLIYFSGLILSETLYAALLAWGFLMLLYPRCRMWWGGVVLLIASVYVRPGAVLLTLALGGVSAWMNWPDWRAYYSLRRGLFARVSFTVVLALACGLTTILALLPWALRNQRVLGSPVLLTSNGGITAYDGFNPLQLDKNWREQGGSDQRFIQTMPELSQLNEIERDRYLKQKAKEFVKNHTSDIFGLTISKILRTWSPVPLSADYGSRRSYVLAGFLYGVPLLILTVVGIVRPTSRGGLSGEMKLVLLTPALYFTVVHGLTVGSLRYRVPIEPLLAVVACSAVGTERVKAESDQ